MNPSEEEHLAGNVSGAVRVGATVRRPTGPWTPAVHALLTHLTGRVPHIPRVYGVDGQGREILDYLPGRVIDTGAELLTPAQLDALVRWTAGFHRAVAGFSHPGPWRYFPIPNPTLIGHNDIAPYNACFAGDAVAGVFDWDLSGPTNPLAELAFMAWNCVPLWEDVTAARAAARLDLMASAYGGCSARQILHAVPPRIELMLDGIPVAAAAGDAGMARLVALGEPERSRLSLQDLIRRIPDIDRALTGDHAG
ncbi:MAG TPA: phosphotransferase [Rugosimonospora sp.]|nr:phosphotransferase [Rugosimonospora sp.]